jgi:positive regulator of sigma E activity
MQKIWKIFEYGYLIIAIVFMIETIINWNTNREKAYLLLLFSMLAVFMYFFRKRYRKRFKNRNN